MGTEERTAQNHPSTLVLKPRHTPTLPCVALALHVKLMPFPPPPACATYFLTIHDDTSATMPDVVPHPRKQRSKQDVELKAVTSATALDHLLGSCFDVPHSPKFRGFKATCVSGFEMLKHVQPLARIKALQAGVALRARPHKSVRFGSRIQNRTAFTRHAIAPC
jgi:hypothetical protein